MMKKACDRCGQMINVLAMDDIGAEYWRYDLRYDCHPYSEIRLIDLCQDCKKDLLQWLKEGAKKPELNGMTIEQIDDILQHPKDFWSHEVEEAKEAAKQVVHILADYSETIDARRFINKMMGRENGETNF